MQTPDQPTQTSRTGNSIRDRKAALRITATADRRTADAARRPEAARALADNFLAAVAPRLVPGTVVSLFLPMGEEIDVGPLTAALAARGFPTALPVMQGRDAPLRFRLWRDGEPLVAAGFGVQEPAGGADAKPDILAVPLLAFDAAGNRLGYGGGYYDRTLRHFRALADAGERPGVLAVGVAYDEQEMATLPVHAGDEPLDMIVTDRRTIGVRAGK